MGTNLFRPGDRCGGNEVLRLLGAGGFAQVYEVVDGAGARRALKVIDTEAGARPKLEARLAQEGAALAMIHHVNVVRLYDAGLHDDRVFLLLELIEGRTLRAALDARDAQGRRPPPETVVRWLRQACEGVAEAHRVGAIHRDLKPENLLVTDGDVVKVIDFGIAKLLTWGMKTTHAQKLGTALYMSPEQIDGKPADPRMDVYAVGLMLYEALAGAHPIVQGPATMIDVCARQLRYRPPPLRQVVPGVPADLGALVDRAVEKDAALRFQTMREMSDALQSALAGLGTERLVAVQSLMPVASPFAITAPVASVAPPAPPAGEPVPDRADTAPISVAADALARTAPVSVHPAPPQEAAPRSVPSIRSAGRPPPSRRAAVAVIVGALVLGVAGGIATVARALAWLHGGGPASISAPARP
jgi:serine/threonine protein kinase